MPSTWMGMVPPLTWQTAHWPATPRTTVYQTPCGAALGGSPPSCVSTSPSVSLRTAAGTGWALPMAGVGLAVTPWCANRPPAVPTVSVHRMAVRVMLDGEGRTAAKDPMICEECALSSFGNYEYPLGLYGLDCGQECQCKDMCPCDPVTGSCNALFQGEKNHRIHGTTRNTRACFEH
ncbi:uncharacterized protein [Salvelinus alpinus]|uniref:uncharacterized protein isoform X3 n=1 Tax=Salvelinus alpinus TaxID=8036 RepID=UPI0039FC1E28